jgi:hypothetical protein
MNEISLSVKLIIFNLVILFFWYLATFRSFQIIHFRVVKIVLTIALISSSLWLIPKIIVISDFDIVLISFCYGVDILTISQIENQLQWKVLHRIIYTEERLQKMPE